MRKCPNCGAEINPVTGGCDYCGSQIIKKRDREEVDAEVIEGLKNNICSSLGIILLIATMILQMIPAARNNGAVLIVELAGVILTFLGALAVGKRKNGTMEYIVAAAGAGMELFVSFILNNGSLCLLGAGATIVAVGVKYLQNVRR